VVPLERRPAGRGGRSLSGRGIRVPPGGPGVSLRRVARRRGQGDGASAGAGLYEVYLRPGPTRRADLDAPSRRTDHRVERPPRSGRLHPRKIPGGTPVFSPVRLLRDGSRAPATGLRDDRPRPSAGRDEDAVTAPRRAAPRAFTLAIFIDSVGDGL